MKIKEEISNSAQQEKPCNHFMVWNIQGGYSYYRCDKCNYIDGKKTFAAQRQEIVEKIGRMNLWSKGTVEGTRNDIIAKLNQTKP